MTRKSAAPLTPDLLARKGQATAATWRGGAGHAPGGGPNVVALTAHAGGASSEPSGRSPAAEATPAPRPATRRHLLTLALVLGLGISGGMAAFVYFTAPSDAPPPLDTAATTRVDAPVAAPEANGATTGPATAKPDDTKTTVPTDTVTAPPTDIPKAPPAKTRAALPAKAAPAKTIVAPPEITVAAPPTDSVAIRPADRAVAVPANRAAAVPVDPVPPRPATDGALRLATGPETPEPAAPKPTVAPSPPPTAQPSSSKPIAKPNVLAAIPATPKLAVPAAAAAVKRPYTVQFASLKSRAAANREWSRLKTRFAGLLGAFEPSIRRATVARRGVFFRLRAGEFTTRGAARKLCAAIQAKRQSCLVIRR